MYKRLFLYYNAIKYMRYKQVLWRIFSLLKRNAYKLFNPFVKTLYVNRFKDTGLNSDYDFFPGVEIIEGIIQRSLGEGGSQGLYKGYGCNKDRIAQLIERAEFNFLNKTIRFHNGIEWQKKGVDRLWLYNLHYFDYAFELGMAYITERKAVYLETFKCLVMDWINENQKPGCGYGWEPYPISLRIVNWIYAYSLFGDKTKDDRPFEANFLKGIAIQTAFLSKNIEYHVSRNHLIKNGKALFLAGCFFEGARASSWKMKGINILIEAVKEQILTDGGHYERSPMYHLIVLQDYLEAFILAKRNNIRFPVEDKLKRMLSFLANILHPDNQIPLFNDSAFGIAKEPGELLTIGSCILNVLPDYSNLCKTTLYTILLTGMTAGLAGRTTSLVESGTSPSSGQANLVGVKAKDRIDDASRPASRNAHPAPRILQGTTLFEDSGLCTIRSRNNDKFLIISCKEPSPSFLPGHSHADIFTYELSLMGKRFVVDSGVGDYSAGRWREYFRGTRAHNTVSVNGQDQSELWGIFGIARRASPPSMRLIADNGDIVLFEGSFKGFSPLAATYHKRSLLFIKETFWVILDTVWGDDNDRRSYNVESFIHVHPDRRVEMMKTNGLAYTKYRTGHFDAVIHDGKETLQVCPIQVVSGLSRQEDTALEIMNGDGKGMQGWYSPEFGNKVNNNVIVIIKKDRLPVHLGYILFPSNEAVNTISASCKLEAGKDTDLRNSALNLEIETPDACYFIRKDGFGVHLQEKR